MEKSLKKEANLKRRNFLLTAVAGSAGAAAAVATVVGAPQVLPESVKPATSAGHSGVSAHMNNYYRTARV